MWGVGGGERLVVRAEEGQLGVDLHSRAVGKHLESSEELPRMVFEEASGV